MDFTVRHMHHQVGLDLPTAKHMAAHAGNDRKLQDNIGSLAAGKRADLLFLDAGLEVRRVFVDGEEVLISRSRP